MAETTAKLRELWKAYECDETKMVVIPFGSDRIRVAPPTAPAWEALAAVLLHHRYEIRTTDTDSYNCRSIKGTNQKSLHSYGIALDVNWTTNPFIKTPDKRKVRFSDHPDQDGRAADVRLGKADTDMTPQLIADALAIRTNGGKPVFEWGGHWTSVKDCMHFEIDAKPDDLTSGIDPATVVGREDFLAVVDEPVDDAVPGQPAAVSDTAEEAVRHVVIARSGLRLRAGPSTAFDAIRTCPPGTPAYVLSREGSWALVDLHGDGQADGYMHAGFLRRAPAETPATGVLPGVPGAVADVTDLLSVDMVGKMFPATRMSAIEANLPFVLDGLRLRQLTDQPVVLMALATIRAETEGFVPVSEGVSRFNTLRTPFDRYEPGTRIGQNLGNTEPGDGARFKGRGYVQLTGRFNYTQVGNQIGSDLVIDPDLANHPKLAGLILAQFLKNKETKIRAAIANNDLKKARKLVNGGSHGFARFEHAYNRGRNVLPG